MRFDLLPDRYVYRPLRRGVNGWDTYALQTALLALGYDLGSWVAYGYFGAATDAAVRLAQRRFSLTVDGIAGIVTQTTLGFALASIARDSANLPLGLPHGPIEHESGWQLGNYTRPYQNLRRDLGAVQQNLEVTETNCLIAFDVPRAIVRLTLDPWMGLRPTKDRYARTWRRPGQPTPSILWQLAVGHWNAPSVTDAYVENRRAHLPDYLLAYIQTCTKYCTEFTL